MTPPWLEPRTAYIHVPFCAHHCGYCDFAVAAGQDDLIELYLDALGMELTALGAPRSVETLFIGGGTPTHLNAKQLRRLLESIARWLPLAGTPEYSIESTPESLDAEKVAHLAEFGVTRVSIGVQSFQPDLLSALDRRHSPDHIPAAIDAVRKRIPALSLDLIFAAPGSTLATWSADLEAALAFEPNHISTYGLTYEKGTPLWKERQGGAVKAVPEESELAMYEFVMDRLAAAGFEHYEISNFARPGQRCRHNERYWANEAYFGFGVGAARYVHGVRELNVRDTKLYVRRMLAGESPVFQSEQLGLCDRAFETIGTQLRRADGIDRDRFELQTGLSLDDLVGAPLAKLIGLGLLSDDGQCIRLTRRGKCVADAIIEELMKANR
ncbi:MAG TPA: radical SAM family heme chaperone HemW [Urbifossiella sp.]|nr:radical SAM family heme chaperone HemW [Urbifossiella sp.]